MEMAKKKSYIFKSRGIVRVTKKKLTFEKGYETNRTEELFVANVYTETHLFIE